MYVTKPCCVAWACRWCSFKVNTLLLPSVNNTAVSAHQCEKAVLGPELLNTNICTTTIRNDRVAREAMMMMMMQQSGKLIFSSRTYSLINYLETLFMLLLSAFPNSFFVLPNSLTIKA